MPTVVMHINFLYTNQVLNTSILKLLQSRNAIFFEDMFLFKKTHENHLLKRMIELALVIVINQKCTSI
jgi:hypothetical protein